MKALKDVFFLGLCITFGCFIAGFIKELCYFFLPDLKKTKQWTIKKKKLVYCATMWTCLALHWGFYDSTNEWPGYECVVPLCPNELCTDEHIPESNGHE